MPADDRSNAYDESPLEWLSFKISLPKYRFIGHDTPVEYALGLVKTWYPVTFRNVKETYLDENQDDNEETEPSPKPVEAKVYDILVYRYRNGCCRINIKLFPPATTETVSQLEASQADETTQADEASLADESNINDSKTGPSAQVVCKYIVSVRNDLLESLEHESKFYEGQLKALQGTVVPNFHGRYILEGTWKDNRDIKFVCILLEDCGEGIADEGFFNLNIEDRITIFKKLVEIHAAGIRQARFEESNVVVKDGDYRIVEFDHASRHNCKWKDTMEQHLGESLKDIGEAFGCQELALCGHELGLWNVTGHNLDRRWPTSKLPARRAHASD
ncbi:hypothetical protein SCHPADRAFT_994280 [Schizopora paradoxa]|uniref:Protein kinase domain-containing protein n=1 Tax=Schizopora paradoxa TaxID=27342 RepID=A0A0H2S171_9AGAM|nr:hypothetical protein SCHPADRAFT_994280 [Schizopora paradoxa]